MVDAEIDNEFPRAVGLFLPERDEVAVAGRLFVFDVCLELPWSSCETEIARGGHARERRLPREQRMLVRGWHGMFVHPLLTVYSGGPKQKSVVSDELEKRI